MSNIISRAELKQKIESGKGFDLIEVLKPALKKMKDLGYTNVYDYAEGKKDWKDAGLDIKGESQAA